MHKDLGHRIAGCTSVIAPALLAGLLLVGGCATETLFRSNFSPTPVGQVPTTADVGTVTTGGAVTVIDPPVAPSSKWVQLSRPNADTSPAVFQGNLSSVKGDGRYTFAATVFMPTNTGVATIQFGSQNLPANDIQNFMHLDLMPNNTVRINDVSGSEFGTFPRNKPFIVQVTLDIDATPMAHIVLAGDGASGTADHNITLPPHILGAKQFGSVRLSMSFPHLGQLQATNISVTRQKD